MFKFVMTRRTLLAVATLQATTVLEGAVLGATPTETAKTMVTIDTFAFVPKAVTVKVGAIVTWDNKDDIPHTVVSSAKLFKSKVLDTGDRFSFTFTTPGAYEYFCSLHPHMTGTIVVEGATAREIVPGEHLQ